MHKHLKIAIAVFAAVILLAVLCAAVCAEAAEVTPAPVSALVTPAPAIDLTALINAVLALCAALITTRLIPWIKSKYEILNTEKLEFWTGVAVTAAEQYYGSGAGQEKKQYVIDYLAEKGFSVDDALIESTVNTYFGKTETVALTDNAASSGELEEAGTGSGERVDIAAKGVG